MTGTGLYATDRSPEAVQRAVADGEVPFAVYGLGKMGLPMASVYAERTGNVVGVDIDQEVVETVSRGDCHIDREPGLSDLVAEQVDRGALAATTDSAAAAREAAVHVVIVPTQLDETQDPDLGALTAALDSIAEGLAAGDVVFIECTVPPGSSRDAKLHLEAASGLDADEFGVAFCPERTSSGRALQDIRGAYPKVVGGVDPESTRVAELVYDELVDNAVRPVASATTAEAVKLFEGVYRDVNIALANELARLADSLDIDVLEAIEAANSQPFCDLHSPGPGVGGHCIPWYPHFLMSQTSLDTPLLRTAREVNDSMPAFTVRETVRELEAAGTPVERATVAVLGLTYRPGVRETRATPSGPVIEGLHRRGASVVACDPLLSEPIEFDASLVPVEDLPAVDPDAVVLVTPHEEFAAVDWDAFTGTVLIDGRDAVPEGAPVDRRYTIGRGRRDRTVESRPTR